jgi:predicted esterase
MRIRLAVVVLLASTASAAAEDLAYPRGKSVQEHAGLTYYLQIPEDEEVKEGMSLIVGLHGMNASAREFATWWEPLAERGFVVCCAQAPGATWSKPNIESVKKIIRHLLEKLPIRKDRVHGVGFSNGGQNLVFLVFDPNLPFATACWMGSGFTGGRVPKRCRKEMAAIALCGSKDYARPNAERTPKNLRGKVRQAEFHEQEGLGHDIPRDLMPYYHYWLTVMEGRFIPGEDQLFDWRYDLGEGRREMEEKKTGAFVYFFSEGDGENDDARHLEHVVFFDEKVREYGKRLQPVCLDVKLDREAFDEFGFTKTPAVAVLDPKGAVVATFEGAVEARALAKAMAQAAKGVR